MKDLLALYVLLVFTLMSCELKPEPINYNNDECAYCKMQISDVRFGAEMVTSKGKIYKYDSAECLVDTYIREDNPDYAYIMVTDYANPRTLIDAVSASYLISANQPSPMGGNLSAYQSEQTARQALEEKGGKLLSFDELLNEYKATLR